MTATRIATIHARDIMRRDVFTLDPDSSVEDAVRAFSEMKIGGAPVVDRSGKLIGVLSARDIARPENLVEHSLAPRQGEYALADISPDDDGSYEEEDAVLGMEDYSPATSAARTVAEFMSPEPISVTSNTTLKALCALMVREHIHRVLVVDNKKLVGVISTLDVARCLAENL